MIHQLTVSFKDAAKPELVLHFDNLSVASTVALRARMDSEVASVDLKTNLLLLSDFEEAMRIYEVFTAIRW